MTHRRASLALLERVAIRPGERAEFLEALRHSGCAEAVVLSTCSRTEIYAHAAPDGPQGLLSVLASHAARPRPEVEAVAEIRTGRSVVEHLFRVTAGLDSRVVGEVDIHGQARAAFRHAAAAGMAGPSLGRLFPEALRCSTRVRTETALGLRARSLGQRAVDVGLETFPAGAEPAVLVVGSGRMASSAVEHLVGRGRRPLVAARNEQVAAKLAGAARVVPLAALAVAVREADLIICATSAASHVVTLPHVRQAMVSRVRPLTVVDLSVPRNVDPQVAALPGVRLIDLEEMYDDANVDASLIAAVQRGRVIAKTDAQRYADGHAARQAGPVIAAIRARVEQTCMTELVRVAAAGAAVQPQDLERAAHAVAGKLLHLPIVTARAAAASGQRDSLLMLCEIFGVHADDVGLSSTATAPERTLLGGAVSSL